MLTDLEMSGAYKGLDGNIYGSSESARGGNKRALGECWRDGILFGRGRRLFGRGGRVDLESSPNHAGELSLLAERNQETLPTTHSLTQGA